MESVSPIYFVGAGLLGTIILFSFIVTQNKILKNAASEMQFTAYNNKKRNAFSIIQFWRSNPGFENAVKRIIFLDYAMMLLYGFTICFGLMVCFENAVGFWRVLYSLGIIFIMIGIMLDAVQDFAIFQHLVHNRFADRRWLTKPKFGLIVLSVLILLSGMIKNCKAFLT